VNSRERADQRYGRKLKRRDRKWWAYDATPLELAEFILENFYERDIKTMAPALLELCRRVKQAYRLREEREKSKDE